jgi:signal transduction histidine kinase
VTVTAEGDDATRFAVSDQGIGIPKADHNQMFSKFFRAGNAMKSPVPGTGLGLYYCKTVVEKHGGRIGFDSEEGKGTTFWFVLPNAGPKA